MRRYSGSPPHRGAAWKGPLQDGRPAAPRSLETPLAPGQLLPERCLSRSQDCPCSGTQVLPWDMGSPAHRARLEAPEDPWPRPVTGGRRGYHENWETLSTPGALPSTARAPPCRGGQQACHASPSGCEGCPERSGRRGRRPLPRPLLGPAHSSAWRAARGRCQGLSAPAGGPCWQPGPQPCSLPRAVLSLLPVPV